MLASSVRLLQNMLLIENTDNVAQKCFQNSTAPNYPMHKTKNCHVNILVAKYKSGNGRLPWDGNVHSEVRWVYGAVATVVGPR